MTVSDEDIKAAERAAHWQKVHLEKDLSQVSWVRQEPSDSLDLLRKAGLGPQTRLVDLGAGISTLADHLVTLPISQLLLVDISAESLRLTRQRLEARKCTTDVSYLVADLGSEVLSGDFDILHDRAVLHFLLAQEARRCWRKSAEHLVAPGGKLVVGTFADDGPTRCSGLDVQRYSLDELTEFLSPIARPVSVSKVVHVTPGGSRQSFSYGVFERT